MTLIPKIGTEILGPRYQNMLGTDFIIAGAELYKGQFNCITVLQNEAKIWQRPVTVQKSAKETRQSSAR